MKQDEGWKIKQAGSEEEWMGTERGNGKKKKDRKGNEIKEGQQEGVSTESWKSIIV